MTGISGSSQPGVVTARSQTKTQAADRAAEINSELQTASSRSSTVTLPDGEEMLFASPLMLPDGVNLKLGDGVQLLCAVTGGVDAISLGGGCVLEGAGGGGTAGSGGTMGSAIHPIAGCNIDALISNANPFQEYMYVRNLTLYPSGGTVRSLLDFVSVFFNSGTQNVVAYANGIATNVLRVRGSTNHNAGQLSFFNSWFTHGVEDNILIEGVGSNGGGSGSANPGDIWFDKCLCEYWATGGFGLDTTTGQALPISGIKALAPGGIIGNTVSWKNGHFECYTATAATSLVYLMKVVGFVLEDATTFLQGGPTNISGVTWANNTENQGGRVINLNASAALAKLIDDQRRAIVVNDSTVDTYYQGGRGTSQFIANEGWKISENTNGVKRMGSTTLIGGTKVVANTAVTANSRIYLTSQVDGGAPGFLRVSARTPGTSFTILSSSGTDTSTVAWLIVEPV